MSAGEAVVTSLSSLVSEPIWVAWRTEAREDGKFTKLPYCAPGRKAETDDPHTWMPHDRAVRVAETIANGQNGGVGIILGQQGELWLAGVDLDTCRDPDTGQIAPWAQTILKRLDTYAEVSPSGAGVKAYLRIDPADIASVRTIMGTQHGRQFKRAINGAAHPPAIELYISHRYFAATWQAMDGLPAALRLVPLDDLRWLIEEAGPAFAGKGSAGSAPNAPGAAGPQSDTVLARLNRAATRDRAIDTALRNAATMRGGSRSEGAMGLGCALHRAGWLADAENGTSLPVQRYRRVLQPGFGRQPVSRVVGHWHVGQAHRATPDQRLALSIELSAARMVALGMLKKPPYGPFRSRITKRTLLSEMALSTMVMIDNGLNGATRPNRAKIIMSQTTTTW